MSFQLFLSSMRISANSTLVGIFCMLFALLIALLLISNAFLSECNTFSSRDLQPCYFKQQSEPIQLPNSNETMNVDFINILLPFNSFSQSKDMDGDTLIRVDYPLFFNLIKIPLTFKGVSTLASIPNFIICSSEDKLLRKTKECVLINTNNPPPQIRKNSIIRLQVNVGFLKKERSNPTKKECAESLLNTLEQIDKKKNFIKVILSLKNKRCVPAASLLLYY